MKLFLFLLLVGFHSFGEAKNYIEIFEKYNPGKTYKEVCEDKKTKDFFEETKEYIEKNIKKTDSLDAAAKDLLNSFRTTNYSPLELSFLLPIEGLRRFDETPYGLIVAKAAALIDQGFFGLEEVALTPEQKQQWETNITTTVLGAKRHIDIFEGPLFENSDELTGKLCEVTYLDGAIIEGHLKDLTTLEESCNSFLKSIVMFLQKMS